MIKRPNWPKGKLVTLSHQSAVLRDNALGDPADRTLDVWLPPGYSKSKRAVTVLFDLVGYTGSGQSHTNWRNFDESIPEQLDRLHAEGKLGRCMVVFPDCFTALGGNQYINSSAIGRYADYLTRELVPYVDREFATDGARDRRGCFGKSSGGYGAMVHGMRYADTWGGIANHSGDAYFDFVYRAEWPATLTLLSAYRPKRSAESKLAKGYDDGRVKRFLEQFNAKRHPGGAEVMALMMLCMAATYDPDPRAPNGFRLPFHADTGLLLESRWQRWLKHDPVRMVADNRKALKSLRAVFIDCGAQDQYHIHFGARQLSAALTKAKVAHRYEEFEGTHSGIDYRMDRSLPFLARALR